jgi:hypothetical protein
MTVTIGRRELLAALGGAVAAWPLAARAAAGDAGRKSNSYHAANAERTETIACSRGGAGRAPRSEVSKARDRSGP